MSAPSTLPASLDELWPSLPLEHWKDTYATLHMWLQIVGKIRLGLAAPVNHWWHCTLHLSTCGLTTSPMPYLGKSLEIGFDFINDKLIIQTDNNVTRSLSLAPRTVADFYFELMSTLKSLGFEITIFTKPQEVQNPIPFEADRDHASYDGEYARRFWRILLGASMIMEDFRGRFIGKCSPVHFFWGSLDLAYTRFSGRIAPKRPGADLITREAYSHECISAGFWPGLGFGEPAFYSYTAPAPAGLDQQHVSSGFYSTDLGEFVLRYEDVRTASDPRAILLGFLQGSYEAGANLANWDRAALERHS